MPPTTRPVDSLLAAGKIRPARSGMSEALDAARLAAAGPTTRALLHELRGD